jgi:hypothetical protein
VSAINNRPRPTDPDALGATLAGVGPPVPRNGNETAGVGRKYFVGRVKTHLHHPRLRGQGSKLGDNPTRPSQPS